jgi:hypothetical protein
MKVEEFIKNPAEGIEKLMQMDPVEAQKVLKLMTTQLQLMLATVKEEKETVEKKVNEHPKS